MTRDAGKFELRRSFSPYAALTIILLGVMALQIYPSIKIHSLEPLIGTGIVWVPFAVWVFIGTRYRVFWNGERIIQKAFAKSDVAIALKEIVAVKNEVSDFSTTAKMQRPFRRITIYGSGDSFIDVSLKHFVRTDVDRLIEIIAVKRPDLVMPKKAVGNRSKRKESA